MKPGFLLPTFALWILLHGAAYAQAVPASKNEVQASVPSVMGVPRDAARIFVSGHSLTDNPLPEYIASIAESLGTTNKWNRQYVVGSSIHLRTRGKGLPSTGWAGYSQGYNRQGENMDVIGELRQPQTIGGDRYDTLLITEVHNLLWAVVNDDSVRYLRHYHDRFIEGNAQGVTYFYQPWYGVESRSNPASWIAYERAASPVWQCIGTRINASLAAEGRPDRILPLPAGIALAALVEKATTGAGVEGITESSVRATTDHIFHDDVHLKRLGVYYMALVSYASIYRRSPVGAWVPQEVNAAQAKSLQTIAWEFVRDYYATNKPLDLQQCRAYLRDSFISLYWGYVRDAYWRRKDNVVWSYVRWVKHVFQWRRIFARDDVSNPFYLDPAADKSYWYPAP